jgi:hypothetical protein
LGCEFAHEKSGTNGQRSAADMDREPWEPRSVREEVGMTVFYIAERLCYRVAFLLTGSCIRRFLEAADYWRARRQRLACDRRGWRDEENGGLLAGQRDRRDGHGGARSAGREGLLDILSCFSGRPKLQAQHEITTGQQ